MKIHLDLSSEDSQLFLDIIDTLVNDKDTIVLDFKDDVKQFLDKKELFKGPFKKRFDKEYEEYILSKLKHYVMDRFNLDAERAAILLDKEMLNLLNLLEDYKNEENYL